MSQETSLWLNQNTLIGFTDKRGTAWHYRASDQGDEPNHYPGAIPVEDVRRRLFDFQFVEGTVESTWFDKDGHAQKTIDPNRKTIINPKNGNVLFVPSTGFVIHDYDEWLLRTSSDILDTSSGELQVGSAGLLKDSAVAWVQFELPDTIKTPEGVDFRPFFTSATSVNGSLASTFQTGAQLVVCDNTLAAGLAEDTPRVKIRHSKNSVGRIGEVREALQLVHTVADSFAAQVAELTRVDVSDKAWAAFLDAHDATKLVDAKGEPKSGRGLTNAENVREAWTQLWNADERVEPWKGTAYGVVAAVNTWAHHLQTARGGDKAERNMLRAVKGEVESLDRGTLDTLNRVLANA